MVNEELIFRRGSGKNHGNHCTDPMQNFRTIDLALADADSKERAVVHDSSRAGHR